MNFDVENLGQVFTPQTIVSDMISLVQNNGRILEPSCGKGAFSNHFSECVAIEFDKEKCPENAINMDFFDYPVSEKFDTIIGNPPYVKYQNILDETKEKLPKKIFDKRSNLYLFFIYKSVLHLKDKGELIFIVPRDFLKSTSAIKLNEFLYKNGTITDLIEMGDTKIFNNASPNTVIFRFEKNNFNRVTNIKKEFRVVNGQILFTKNEYRIKFSDLFYVKVGAVSGADKYFKNNKGNIDFICSFTRKNNKTKKMFYNIKAPELEKHKEKLLKRKIKKFNESNWYMWGRSYHDTDKNRIYVNCKTRIENPFFTHNCKAYDGSVLAIFPKFDTNKEIIEDLVNMLNDVDWNELGFICDGRYIFSQKSLKNSLLPNSFSRYLKYI